MKHMVIFFHGFDSSSKTDKFSVIKHQPKLCLDVDYRSEQYLDIDANYHDIIDSALADGYIPVLVGHSLGGYWAVKMAQRFALSVVLVNPQLWPTSELIRDIDMYRPEPAISSNSPKYVYVETGDDVIDVERTINWAMKYASVRIYEGGHHRVEKLDAINTLIDKAIKEELVS